MERRAEGLGSDERGRRRPAWAPPQRITDLLRWDVSAQFRVLGEEVAAFGFEEGTRGWKGRKLRKFIEVSAIGVHPYTPVNFS